MAAAQRREKKRANMIKSLVYDNGYVPFTCDIARNNAILRLFAKMNENLLVVGIYMIARKLNFTCSYLCKKYLYIIKS